MGVRESLGDVDALADLDALVLAAVVWFLAKFLRYAFPPLFPAFRDAYGVENGELGVAFTAMMLVYALMQFPSGALADRFGRVPVVTAGALVAAAGALALVPASPFAVLVAAMVLVGAGTGVHKTVSVGLLSTVYPTRTGRALGVLDTVGAFGGVAAPAAVVFVGGAAGLAAGLDWHAVFLAAGLAGVALAAAFAVRLRDRKTDDATGRGDVALGKYAALFRKPRFAAFVVVAVGVSFAYNGVAAFLPLYLTDAAGLGDALAGALYSGLFVVSLVQPATGELADRLTPLRVVAGTLSVASVGLLGVLLGASPLVVGAGVLVFGLGSHGYRPVRGAYLLELVPDELAGGGLGVVRTVLMGAGALAPAVVGLLTEHESYRLAFAVLLVSLVVAAAVALGLLATE